MNISRRKFLGAAPVLTGAVLSLRTSLFGQSAAGSDALSELNWDSFYPFIGTDFTFGRGGNAASLKLISMRESAPEGTKGANQKKCFVMRFQGPYDNVLTQNTYSVNHFNLGDFDLFITDGGTKGREQYYTAVINRLIS